MKRDNGKFLYVQHEDMGISMLPVCTIITCFSFIFLYNYWSRSCAIQGWNI